MEQKLITRQGREYLEATLAAPDGAPAEPVEGGNLPRSRLRVFKLTKTSVGRMPFAASGQEFYFDEELTGFGLRVGKTAKTYFAERSVKGRGISRRVDIGRTDLVTADEARQRAMHLLAQMAQGIDPAEERAKERKARELAESQQITLRNLWDEFHTDRLVTRKASTLRGYKTFMDTVFGGRESKRRSAVYVKWMDRPVQEIGREEVFNLHRRLGRESGQAYANAAMRVLSSVLNFGITKGRLAANPVDVLRRDWYRLKPRKTTIPDHKLGDWFRAVDAVRSDKENPAGPVGADYLEFTLLTGLRRNESAKLTWDRVDLKKQTVTVQETKNSDPLVLPLSDYLLTLLERRQAAAGDSPWVFPSPGRKGKDHLAEPRCVAEPVGEACGVCHTIHDLRRTFISAAARLVPYAVVKTIVNHRATKKGDVDARLRVARRRGPAPAYAGDHRLLPEAQGRGAGHEAGQGRIVSIG